MMIDRQSAQYCASCFSHRTELPVIVSFVQHLLFLWSIQQFLMLCLILFSNCSLCVNIECSITVSSLGEGTVFYIPLVYPSNNYHIFQPPLQQSFLKHIRAIEYNKFKINYSSNKSIHILISPFNFFCNILSLHLSILSIKYCLVGFMYTDLFLN